MRCTAARSTPGIRSARPGGSSGGAAAAVATGMGALAHGNDRAGSIRYPSYACGVYGLRPTLGRMPTFEPGVPETLAITTQLANTQGPLARSVRDLRLGTVAMMGRDARDPWWVPVPLRDEVPPKGRIALCAGVPEADVDPAVAAAVKQAGKWLADAGYEVEEVAPPHLHEAGSLFFTLVVSENAVSTRRSRRHDEGHRGARRRGVQARPPVHRGVDQGARLRGLRGGARAGVPRCCGDGWCSSSATSSW